MQLPNVEAELRAKQRELSEVDRDLAARTRVGARQHVGMHCIVF